MNQVSLKWGGIKFIVPSTNHAAAHAMQDDINHVRNVRYWDSEQIIGGHCAQVPLSSLLSAAISAFIDHCLRKHVCDWNALIKGRGQLFALPSVSVGGWNWFWILNWVIYYQELPSIYNLKAGPAASVAGLLIGVFTGPGGGGSPVPLPLNACQRVWSFHHQRWYTPLWGAQSPAEHGLSLTLWQHWCGTRASPRGQTKLAAMFLWGGFMSHLLEHGVMLLRVGRESVGGSNNAGDVCNFSVCLPERC